VERQLTQLQGDPCMQSCAKMQVQTADGTVAAYCVASSVRFVSGVLADECMYFMVQALCVSYRITATA
jgi:hypothetical protein